MNYEEYDLTEAVAAIDRLDRLVAEILEAS